MNIEKKRKILAAVATDKEVLKCIDKVAFNQEELEKLLENNEKIIFLCKANSNDSDFKIPLSKKNRIYIGLSDTKVSINNDVHDKFDDINIFLVNLTIANNVYGTILTNYDKLANCNNATVLYYIGEAYFYGNGVNRDCDKAKAWYEKAEKLNNGQAIYSLGYMYQTGMGVEKNLTKAKEKYEQAEKLGAIDDELKKFHFNQVKDN